MIWPCMPFKRRYKGPKSSAQWVELGGRRIYFRSRWEVNYARILQRQLEDGHILGWWFEPTTFWFEGIRRGTTSYLPDFRVRPFKGDEYYVEVKGFMDARSRTKLKRMAKYYPDVTLIVVGVKEYNRLARLWIPHIPEWQFSAKGLP